MSEIHFNDENQYQRNRPLQQTSGGLTAFIIKMGLAQDTAGANKVLLILLVVVVLITIVINLFLGRNEPTYQPDQILPNANYAPTP